jgi:polyhydroxyalkanoate synthase
MLEGPIAALDVIEQATGERGVNAIGYCIGGTLMAAMPAYMAAHGDGRIKSITFFTTMVDFEEPGELGGFLDDKQLKTLEERMSQDGYLDGSEMSGTFNMMRANDLIWSFVVNNYLLGKKPFPFDLLYWNSDSTRMPAVMHSFCLRKMYQENRLVEPGGINIDGVEIDLRTIKIPSFILSTQDDHIAGVVNPPTDPAKYGYLSNNRKRKTPEKWLEGATWHDESWWPEWKKWLAHHSGGVAPPRIPGDGSLPEIEDAPGSYVQVRTGA